MASAWLAGGVLSLGSVAGFVTVLAIAARNGITLISHYRHVREVEGVAAATALALLPIVVSGNQAGQEIEYPMAVVILGGLITSTVLNLFVMPSFYRRLVR